MQVDEKRRKAQEDIERAELRNAKSVAKQNAQSEKEAREILAKHPDDAVLKFNTSLPANIKQPGTRAELLYRHFRRNNAETEVTVGEVKERFRRDPIPGGSFIGEFGWCLRHGFFTIHAPSVSEDTVDEEADSDAELSPEPPQEYALG